MLGQQQIFVSPISTRKMSEERISSFLRFIYLKKRKFQKQNYLRTFWLRIYLFWFELISIEFESKTLAKAMIPKNRKELKIGFSYIDMQSTPLKRMWYLRKVASSYEQFGQISTSLCPKYIKCFPKFEKWQRR